jgi:hypothetical protein
VHGRSAQDTCDGKRRAVEKIKAFIQGTADAMRPK